ncbi:PAS domain-containing protein [Bradyrhizobium sp.]|uniref:PAS domain-containing protein n=1 Tax=Bradyrhizobium sp. TaxID=376 RepID=UPI003C26D5D4
MIGLMVLAGWTFDIPALKSVVPGFISMQPWTALAILLAAVALWLAASDRGGARAASAIPAIALAIIVGLPLGQYATGGSLGTDLWLFPGDVLRAQTIPYPNPGRMSPLTSIGLTTLAGALVLAPRVRSRIGQAVFSSLASVGLALTLTSVLAYILRLESLDNLVLHNQIAIPTALALAALCAGTLALRPDAGWVSVVAAQGNPGWLAAALFGGAVMLLVFGSEAAVTAGMAARGISNAGLALATLRSTLADAETGQRGYLLTGREDYLQPYDAARARLNGELTTAEASLALVDAPPPPLRQLRALVMEKMSELGESIALRRAGDQAGALALLNSGRGKALLDAIRSMADGFLPTMRTAGSSSGARAELAAAIAASGAVGLGALAFWSLIAAGRVRRESHATIAESEARQRDLLATLALGTFMARDLRGTILYWADGCARLYGWTSDQAVGRSAQELLGTVFPVPPPEIEATLMRAGEWMGDLRHHARDGRELLVTAYKVMRRGTTSERPVVLEFLTDVTALRQAEAALANSRALMRTVIETTPGLIYAKDRQGCMILSNRAVAALINKPENELEGRTDREFLDDAAQAEAVMMNDRQVMQTGVPEQFEELAGEANGRPRVWLSTKSPMRDAAGQVIGMVGVSIEITERKHAEDRLHLMVDELSHRVKNTLVTVQALAAQTLRAADPEIFRALEGRLKALAAAHDVLTRESWKDADLHEVIEQALASFAVAGAGRLQISGPRLRLQPRVAVTLSMALHELATNAIRYGAWSAASGQVNLRWEITGDVEPRLLMIWSEAQGPPVTALPRRGFGTRMIERSLAQDLGGTAQIVFHPGGLTCAIDAPLAGIAAVTGVIPLPRVGSMQGNETWH